MAEEPLSMCQPLLEGRSEADSVHPFSTGSVFTAGIGIKAPPGCCACSTGTAEMSLSEVYIFFLTAEEVDFFKK